MALLWLWLWHRLAAAAPIGPLVWELTYAVGEALKKKKKKRKREVSGKTSWPQWLKSQLPLPMYRRLSGNQAWGGMKKLIFFFFLMQPIECLCPLKIPMLKPNPQSDSIRRWGLLEWLDHKGGALANGISALIKEGQRAPYPSHHVRLQQKDSCLWTRKQAFTRLRIFWCLDLGLLASRAVSNKFLLFANHQVCGILF